MGQWVDFKQLREQLDVEDVLQHYGVEFKRKGRQAVAACPLPTHRGQTQSQSFSMSFQKGVWRCFSCCAQGNVLDFAVRMEGLDPAKPRDVRQTALLLQERFGGADAERSAPHASKKPAKQPALVKPAVKPDAIGAAPSKQPVVVNAPLDFELKDLDPDHPYLKSRGFTIETIAHFGLGFCSRGLMRNRVVIPLHNSGGKLVGYAGRVTDDKTITKDNPKYKFPGERERNGVRGMVKSCV